MSSIFPQYGAVPTSPEEAEYAASTLDTHTHAGAPKGIQGGCAKAFFKFLEGGTIGPRFEQHMKARKPSIMPQDTLNIHAESLRFIAFVSFWFMCVAAVILTTILIKPETIEDSMLMYVFGYNSICVMWDYYPSRELVAMIYPMFEYTFLFYILVDFIHMRLACKSGGVPGAAQWLYRFVVVCLPFKVMLVCWFRMMFIFQVYPNPEAPEPKYEWADIRGVVGQCVAFLGVQLALFMVAFENALFMTLTNISYPILGRKWTKILGWLYIFMFFCSSGFMVIGTISLFYGDKPIFNMQALIAIRFTSSSFR